MNVGRLRHASVPWVPLGLVVVGALILDLVGIGWGLPFLYHPDEPTNLMAVGHMVQNRTLNHGQWQYPAFSFDIQALVNAAAVGIGTAVGWVKSAADANHITMVVTGVGRLSHPGMLVIGRVVCVIESVATVVAVAWMAHLATPDRRAVWMAPLLVAILPISVGFAYYMTPDPLSGLTSTLAVCGALWAYRRPSWRTYAFTGAMVGLAASSKYNCAIVGISLVVAHLCSGARSRWSRLAVAAGCAVAAFLITTPYAIFDFHGLVQGLKFDETHYSTGHVGAQGDSPGANLRWIFDSFGLFLLGLVGLWWARARREILIVGAFVVAYYVVLSSVTVRFERNLLPLVPALALLVVLGGLALWDLGRARLGRPATAGMGVLLVVALAWTLYGTAGELHNSLSDQKAQSYAWVQEHVPVGATVVVDPYSPFVDPAKWHVVVLRATTANGVAYPAWYVLQNPVALRAAVADVVITTSAGSGRYLALHSSIARATLAYLTGASCARHSFDHATVDVWVLHCTPSGAPAATAPASR
jgi:4-amino-4-deoxy-L-arabinose transferase-like glycosyltransferase